MISYIAFIVFGITHFNFLFPKDAIISPDEHRQPPPGLPPGNLGPPPHPAYPASGESGGPGSANGIGAIAPPCPIANNTHPLRNSGLDFF